MRRFLLSRRAFCYALCRSARRRLRPPAQARERRHSGRLGARRRQCARSHRALRRRALRHQYLDPRLVERRTCRRSSGHESLGRRLVDFRHGLRPAAQAELQPRDQIRAAIDADARLRSRGHCLQVDQLDAASRVDSARHATLRRTRMKALTCRLFVACRLVSARPRSRARAGSSCEADRSAPASTRAPGSKLRAGLCGSPRLRRRVTTAMRAAHSANQVHVRDACRKGTEEIGAEGRCRDSRSRASIPG